jgi:hypothetical protein
MRAASLGTNRGARAVVALTRNAARASLRAGAVAPEDLQ